MNAPKLSPQEVNRLLALHNVTPAVAILGVRGYRRDTMGRVGVNDVGIYDDALFVRFPGGVLNCNGNTDPSRIGYNPGVGKPFAQLKTGVWPFILGLHKGKYMALRQPYEEQTPKLGLEHFFGIGDPRAIGHFTVIRDDGRGRRYEDTAYHAINIHMGGNNGTSSWGCQTLPPEGWHQFIDVVIREMKRAGQLWIPYCLIDGPVS